MLKQTSAISAAPRLLLVDGLRALAAAMILWHHFTIYGPFWAWLVPEPGAWTEVFRDFRLAVQVFFVIGGYVAARSLSKRTWNLRHAARFVAGRYCRLGLPYLAALVLALVANATARGSLSEADVGAPPTWPQILAHVVFLQDILGYESLSAGFWFVGIEFQLGLVFVAMLLLRDALSVALDRQPGEESSGITMLLGWGLAIPGLFYFNLDEQFDVWAVYFFGQFFLGVTVFFALQRGWPYQALFWLYALTAAVALGYAWRWTVATALFTAVGLYCAGAAGLLDSWPRSRVASCLGRTSYSLFLVHFPVLLFVSTLWLRLDRTSSWDAMSGLAVAYLASLAMADVFYRLIESPTARLAQKIA